MGEITTNNHLENQIDHLPQRKTRENKKKNKRKKKPKKLM